MKLFWVLAVAAVINGCMYVSGSAEGETSMHATAIDVGQGLAVLLEYDGRYAMYDFGPDSVGVVDSLLARGIDTLEWVVLSHNHRDHIGGFWELAGRGVFVRQLYVGPDVLWPASYLRVGENRASVVLLGKFGASKLLLTGDLDSVGERHLLEMNPTLSAELLQVAHHGSAGSNTLSFLSQVSPKYAFVSVGQGNRYGHPAPSVVRKLNLVLGDSTKLYRTDLQGSVRFELSPNMGILH